MSAKLTATKNYSLFKLCSFNRNVTKTAALERSMKQHGFLPAYPLHVIRLESGQLEVKGGHHRLHVAMKLGIPVYYVVCNDTATVHELETSTVQWKMRDYLTSFCRCGNNDYLYLADFISKTGIGIDAAVSMLSNHASGSNRQSKDFRAGSFTVVNANHAWIVGNCVIALRNAGLTWANHTFFVYALSRVCMLPEFDVNQFIARVTVNLGACTRQATLNGYLEMIERVYNHRSQQKVPLAFLANEIIRQRIPKNLRF